MGMMRHERGGLRAEPEDAHAPVSAQSSALSPQSYEIEIDELVLTGFTQSEGRQIAESLRETLAHLVAGDIARWRGAESMNVEALDAGKVQVRRTGRAQSTGELVARAIYGSLPR